MTISELNLIRELRKERKSLSQIAEIVNRSKESISFICHYYNLPNNRWTREEKEILVREYGNYPTKELSRKLGRSYGTIRVQVSKQRSRNAVLNTHVLNK